VETIAAPQTQDLLQAISGVTGALFLTGVALLIFRTTIQNFVSGILFKRGAELSLDQTVLISKRKFRLVRIGLYYCTFYSENGHPKKMVVPNSKLVELTLEIVLDEHASGAN
tara:strand:- start:4310 stop:4645 length:336 start_codon:yes stop_codon:yes gene_type:complete